MTASRSGSPGRGPPRQRPTVAGPPSPRHRETGPAGASRRAARPDQACLCQTGRSAAAGLHSVMSAGRSDLMSATCSDRSRPATAPPPVAGPRRTGGRSPPSGRAIATPGVAGFRTEWSTSRRNRRPTSSRNEAADLLRNQHARSSGRSVQHSPSSSVDHSRCIPTPPPNLGAGGYGLETDLAISDGTKCTASRSLGLHRLLDDAGSAALRLRLGLGVSQPSATPKTGRLLGQAGLLTFCFRRASTAGPAGNSIGTAQPHAQQRVLFRPWVRHFGSLANSHYLRTDMAGPGAQPCRSSSSRDRRCYGGDRVRPSCGPAPWRSQPPRRPRPALPRSSAW